MRVVVTLGRTKLEFRARSNRKGIVEWNQGDEVRMGTGRQGLGRNFRNLLPIQPNNSASSHSPKPQRGPRVSSSSPSVPPREVFSKRCRSSPFGRALNYQHHEGSERQKMDSVPS